MPSFTMKNVYWGMAVAMAVTVLVVLFVPGVDDWIEQTLLGYLGRAAR
jgi:hypothetical protein